MQELAIDDWIARTVERLGGRPDVRTSLAARPDADASLARRIDHTALKPETSPEDVRRLCREARKYGFAAACVSPCYVALAAESLERSTTAPCTVAGFPLGASHPEVKAREAERAAQDGAVEVDVVLNVGLLKSGAIGKVYDDLRGVVQAFPDGLTKVILETFLLSEQEKVAACVVAQWAGAHYVKTSTGYAGGGATPADVALMRRVVGAGMGVKAAGGIRTQAEARTMIACGADRIGASASVTIMEEAAGPSEK